MSDSHRVVVGRVVRVEPYGIYFTTPAGEVLVHRTEISWVGRDPTDRFSVDDEATLLVLHAVGDGMFAGSLMRLPGVDNPYRALAVGERHGAHVSLMFSGHVFVTLENGTAGLLAPCAQSRNLSKGDQVEVVVDRVDPERPAMDVSIAH